MRVFQVPARYAPELEAKLRSVIRDIEFDMKMREFDGDTGSKYVAVDDARTGSLVILVGECPAEDAATVLPLERLIKVA